MSELHERDQDFNLRTVNVLGEGRIIRQQLGFDHLYVGDKIQVSGESYKDLNDFWLVESEPKYNLNGVLIITASRNE